MIDHYNERGIWEVGRKAEKYDSGNLWWERRVESNWDKDSTVRSSVPTKVTDLKENGCHDQCETPGRVRVVIISFSSSNQP